MIPELIMIALLIACLPGGNIYRLADHPIRQAWVIAIPVAIYAASWMVRLAIKGPVSVWVFGGLHLASIASLILLCALNHKVRGVKLIAAGLVMNAIAIASNNGFMPATRSGIAAVYGKEYLAKTLSEPHVRSSLMTADTHVYWLCDIIPKTIGFRPFCGVYSIGDFVMTLGLCIAIITIARTPLKSEAGGKA